VLRRTFAEELAICQHFYCKSFPYATAPAQNAGTGGSIFVPQLLGASIAQQLGGVRFPARMRVAPLRAHVLQSVRGQRADAQPDDGHRLLGLHCAERDRRGLQLLHHFARRLCGRQSTCDPIRCRLRALMDLYSKYKAISDTLRNQVCELELVTRLTKDDGSTQELTHVRRAVCKKALRQKNKTTLTFADIDRSALDLVFPFETFTTAGFPELFVDHVGWRIPQGFGDVVKVPLAWISKSGGVWKYAGPKVLQTATLLAVYRGSQPGQGSVVDPSEYTAGTAVDSVSGAVVATVNFTREQLDFQGRPYVIEADYTLSHGAAMGGGTSYRAPANEIARILALYGISIDTTTFGNVASTDTALSFLLDGLYGSRDKGRTGISIIEDLLAAGRSWLSTATGAWAIIQDTVKASTWQFDAAADQSRSTHTAMATSRRRSRSRTARERAASRTTPDSSRGPRPGRPASSSSPTRTSAITRSPIASSPTGRSASIHCASPRATCTVNTSRTAR
jgi:hypothetical protein